MKRKRNAKAVKRYHHLSATDKVIDLLVILGVLLGLAILIIEWFFHPSEAALRTMQRLDLLVLAIFLMDLTRAFFYSQGILDFFKHQWLDLLVIAIMIVSFSTFAFLGAGRLSRLLREEKIIFLLEEEKPLRWITRLWKVVFFRRAGKTGYAKELRRR